MQTLAALLYYIQISYILDSAYRVSHLQFGHLKAELWYEHHYGGLQGGSSLMQPGLEEKL